MLGADVILAHKEVVCMHCLQIRRYEFTDGVIHGTQSVMSYEAGN
jgi:ornithine carbamoyltransferase